MRLKSTLYLHGVRHTYILDWIDYSLGSECMPRSQTDKGSQFTFVYYMLPVFESLGLKNYKLLYSFVYFLVAITCKVKYTDHTSRLSYRHQLWSKTVHCACDLL